MAIFGHAAMANMVCAASFILISTGASQATPAQKTLGTAIEPKALEAAPGQEAASELSRLLLLERSGGSKQSEKLMRSEVRHKKVKRRPTWAPHEEDLVPKMPAVEEEDPYKALEDKDGLIPTMSEDPVPIDNLCKSNKCTHHRQCWQSAFKNYHNAMPKMYCLCEQQRVMATFVNKTGTGNTAVQFKNTCFHCDCDEGQASAGEEPDGGLDRLRDAFIPGMQ
mmetsp:Transcript_10705/g.19590  ORF Transcript_10705/g.19590 Transcript_10705/m.19590 type:complete len:223 (+) Transcript_10705:50-718(+)